MLKKVISTLYVMVVVAMAVATVVEKTRGTTVRGGSRDLGRC